ncbi:hypothetical protein KL949_000017 [Ogataea haglerorum]|nr:hypothetical protein KL913_000754 [Ogataea haglerorum]KAG7722967.1 hypothetical protein KL949_000017 [Ogataea haglerorum]KAG7772413.1 hypothetical protein KL931_000753 [Ogataea haglerorum]
MPSLRPGILAPLPCFFNADETINYDQFAKHTLRLAAAGIMPVVSGSMGEAIHLEREERIQLIKTARIALDQAGFASMPIMAGAGALSTRQAVQYAKDAASAGADSVLVIPPGYYGLGEANLEAYYTSIAKQSPIPVLIYNFPAVAGGIDMSSDLILRIAGKAPNVAGCKLTCASVAKLARVAQSPLSPRTTGIPFFALCGFIDFLLPGIIVGAQGAITGVPNFAPKTCQELWELCQKQMTPENLTQANKLHLLVSNADAAASSAGIPGMKALLHYLEGCEPYVRSPLLPASAIAAEKLISDPAIASILEHEKQLSSRR